MKRRDFLLSSAGTAVVFPFIAQADATVRPLRLSPPENGHHYRPLEQIRIYEGPSGTVEIYDAKGILYRSAGAEKIFRAGGALGTQQVVVKDGRGRVIAAQAFQVAATTHLTDGSGQFRKLFDDLYWTMVHVDGVEGDPGREADVVRIGGKYYRYFVCWLRDHVHTMKGMKYFYPELKTAIELYADTQREDGMIFDNIYARKKEKNWWDKRFRYGDFIRPVDNGNFEMKRIPVEADVEYLFVEGLYYTWKATGDHAWMQRMLDAGIRALEYCRTSPYRWSEKYQLIKRGFTIDTWDFQSDLDIPFSDHDIMVIYLNKTRFGIMHGDNTGYAAACLQLAEMLRVGGRTAEAEAHERLAREIKERLDALAWNGRFYLHHIPEEDVERDLGVDTSKQVSLSNAYNVNRNLTGEQRRAIIESYLDIRKQMPQSSPGEWYAIFPPFTKGFDGPAPAWEYMNGGVTTIVGGELARGAFLNGYESYGADILRRMQKIAENRGGFLYCVFQGKAPEVPQRQFGHVDLASVANTVFPHPEASFEGKTFRETAERTPAGLVLRFHGIPFLLTENGLRTSVALGYPGAPEAPVSLPFNRKAASFYFLHTYQGRIAGMFTVEYEDGTAFTDYITQEKFGHWWSGADAPMYGESTAVRKAWRSDNDRYEALYLYGFNNPNPEKTVRHIRLEGVQGPANRRWQIVAMSWSDKPVWLPSDGLSYGIPHNWGAAAVLYGLIEGLAGVRDTGVAFDRAVLAPRWPAAGERRASGVVKYEASGGYLAFDYEYHDEENKLSLIFTGTAGQTEIEVLLPDGFLPQHARLNGKSLPFQIKDAGKSRYLMASVSGIQVNELELFS